MNPIERVFTTIIQSFLRIAVELVRGLFGLGATPETLEDAQATDEERDDE